MPTRSLASALVFPPKATRRVRRRHHRIALSQSRRARRVLRYITASIMLWLGALKFVSLSGSMAEDLIRRSLPPLPPDLFFLLLGGWETVIGVCLLSRPLQRAGALLLLLQIPFLLLPLMTMPGECFAGSPFILTAQGQEIIKNALFVGAALVINRNRSALQPGDEVRASKSSKSHENLT
ncbi:MAG: hypothetical protein JF599_00865 [Verrucomicrobia bacterium]|nr:hypothetical protein [Verrucomicrobiota bacterium]